MPTVASAVELVVHCELQHGGHRRVTEILATTGALSAPLSEGGVIEAARLFAIRDGVLRPTGSVPPRVQKFAAAGFDPVDLLRVPA